MVEGITLLLFVLFFVGVFASVLVFLYTLPFSGPWAIFFWVAGFSLVLVVVIKLLARGALDDKRQMNVVAMLSELLGGTFGWTWMVLGGASLVLFFKALLFGGRWSAFFVCLLASAACKWFKRYSMMAKERAMFKGELVEKRLTKEQARRIWIARAQEIIQQHKPPA